MDGFKNSTKTQYSHGGSVKMGSPKAAISSALKAGKVVEKGTGEVYASKAAQKRHEAKESPAYERKEHRKGKYATGGKVPC